MTTYFKKVNSIQAVNVGNLVTKISEGEKKILDHDHAQ